jgi:hypothetical protein
MVIALYVIALAMIAGGAYAAVEGYGIVLNERGWSMVIAGTVVATGGVLLLGAAVIAGRLKRMLGELTRLRERAGRLDAAAPVLPQALSVPGEPPEGTALAAASRAGLARRGGPAGGAPPERPDEPIEHAVLKAADVIPEPAREPVPETAPAGAPKAALARAAPGTIGPDEDSMTFASPTAGPEAPTVVGTYNSGGNAYVMYSDGSIEADTPTGRYRFKSLDELKDFIASGGEEGGEARAS